MKLFLHILCCLFPLSLLHAAAPPDSSGFKNSKSRLTLDEVICMVRAHNPGVKEALRKWDAMKARIPQEKAWDDPRVSATSRLGRFVKVGPDAFTDQMWAVEQMVPISGKNRSRARIAAAEAVYTFEEARRVELDLLSTTRATCFRLQAYSAQIALSERDIALLDQTAAALGSKYEAGMATASQVLAAEIEKDKALETKGDLERMLAAEQSKLNVLMNRDAFAPVSITGDIVITSAELPGISRLQALALINRPEVKMAEAAVSLEKARLELAHRQWVPDPVITLQAQHYNDSAQAVSEFDAGISFNVPWGNTVKYSAGVREAGANLDAAQQRLERVKRETIGKLRDVLQNTETAHHHLELFHDRLLPRARREFETVQSDYESGKASFTELINVQQSLQELEKSELQHLADYHAALAELEAVTGANLDIFPAATVKQKSIP